MLALFRSLGYFRKALAAGRKLDPEESANLHDVLLWVEQAALTAVTALEATMPAAPDSSPEPPEPEP